MPSLISLSGSTRLADRHASRRLRDPDRFREVPRNRVQTPLCTSDFPELEPMQIGRTKLSFGERQHWRDKHLCLYCGDSGHLLARCPLKDNAHQCASGSWRALLMNPTHPLSIPLYRLASHGKGPNSRSQYCWIQDRMPVLSVLPHPCILAHLWGHLWRSKEPRGR